MGPMASTPSPLQAPAPAPRLQPHMRVPRSHPGDVRSCWLTESAGASLTRTPHMLSSVPEEAAEMWGEPSFSQLGGV